MGDGHARIFYGPRREPVRPVTRKVRRCHLHLAEVAPRIALVSSR